MKTDTLEFKKMYYFQVTHWNLKLNIKYIREKSYPLDWWKEQLKENLIKRNQHALKINKKRDE